MPAPGNEVFEWVVGQLSPGALGSDSVLAAEIVVDILPKLSVATRGYLIQKIMKPGGRPPEAPESRLTDVCIWRLMLQGLPETRDEKP